MLTKREITIIRVALLRRLDYLKGRQPQAYEETRELMQQMFHMLDYAAAE